MDIFIDPMGCVIVRNCGCEKHGLNSFWTDHDKAWRARHRAEATRIVGEHRARFRRAEQSDEALRVISEMKER